MKLPKFKFNTLLIAAAVLVLQSCGGGSSSSQKMKELTDEQYPDDPDRPLRSADYRKFSHGDFTVTKNGDHYDFKFNPNNAATDTLIIKDIDMRIFMPYIPTWIRDDEYASLVGIVNQEWNRQQIKFMANDPHLEFVGKGDQKAAVTRVDLARNCLNARLWELIMYTEEDGKQKMIYHGWFDFPMDLHAKIFEEVNGMKYSKYAEHLDNWKDLPTQKLALNKLSTVIKDTVAEFTNLNDKLYPMTGARAKKKVNIVTPKEAEKIQDFLNDDTRYATFSPPGCYNTKDPRVTYLSLLSDIEKITLRKATAMTPKKDECTELVFDYKDPKGTKTTLIIGGLNLDNMPVKDSMHHHQGYRMPMGIANHTFYADYNSSKTLSEDIPYYGILLNEKGEWLDSHKIGIDGPLIHWDDKEPQLLHFYILSFERHSLVAHFTIKVPEEYGKSPVNNEEITIE